LSVTLVSIILVCVVLLHVQWHFHLWCVWVVPAFAQPVAAFAWVALHPKPDPYLAFVSYRTTEDGATARLIADHLLGRGCRTFLDVKSLEAGKFDEQLLGAIDNAKFFVLILSSSSLARCVEPDDWVLKELSHALAKRKRIVPVFKDDFDFNDKKNVPDLPEIGKLRSCHGLKCSIREFDVFMQGLARLLGVR
jgi:hypothetical protein